MFRKRLSASQRWQSEKSQKVDENTLVRSKNQTGNGNLSLAPAGRNGA
jgi:hypothetical protein